MDVIGMLETLINEQPMFEFFNEDERQALNALALPKKYMKGEFIANYGEPWPFIFLVAYGHIDVFKFSPEGRNLGVLTMTQGELFWSPSFFDGGPLPVMLEAKDASHLFLWDQESVLPLLRKNQEALWAWTMMLVKRIRFASNFIEELAFHPLAGRLARLLLDQFNEQDDIRVARELTLDEMSARINTSPVMVCKLLSRFASDGLIKVSRTSFELLDRHELEKVCGPRT
jgi:CRP/FNR family cyclic AMP-dependent transcriptional regulator